MGYGKTERMDFESCEKLKAEVRDWLKKHKVGAARLSLQADVREDVLRRWLDGEKDRLHIVAYARLWLAVHPESED